VTRADGRTDDELRPVKITRGFQKHPAGSVLVEFGDTKIVCAASVSEGVPRWRKGSGLGWLTAEYAMLPSATDTRSDRESVRGRIGGRTHEITWLGARGALADPKPLSCQVAAVSVGVVDGRVRLDLPYEEDSRAEVDANIVATDTGTLIEVQSTGEGATFTRRTLDAMLDMALVGIRKLADLQSAALAAPYPRELPGKAS
jgi:ribonuclease PH